MCRQTLSSSYGSISFVNASFRVWALQTHPACDAFNRNPQCRWIVCRKTEREKKKIKVTASLAQEFGLNASWMLLVLFWELSHTRTHITSRMAAHSASFTINSLVALKCYFIKLLWNEKIKFFFKWLFPPLRLFVKKAESLNCYWKLHLYRPTDFLLVLFSTNLLIAYTTLVDGKT